SERPLFLRAGLAVQSESGAHQRNAGAALFSEPEPHRETNEIRISAELRRVARNCGIVGDVRDRSLGRKPGPMMYVPFAQAPLYGGEVVVRTSLGASSVAAGIRQATHAIDKDLPVTDIESFPDALGESISQERFRTYLLGSFSAIALVLAAI